MFYFSQTSKHQFNKANDKSLISLNLKSISISSSLQFGHFSLQFSTVPLLNSSSQHACVKKCMHTHTKTGMDCGKSFFLKVRMAKFYLLKLTSEFSNLTSFHLCFKYAVLAVLYRLAPAFYF